MAQSIASWHISSPISAFLMMAFRSDILTSPLVLRLPGTLTPMHQARNASPAGVQALALAELLAAGCQNYSIKYNSIISEGGLLVV